LVRKKERDQNQGKQPDGEAQIKKVTVVLSKHPSKKHREDRKKRERKAQ